MKKEKCGGFTMVELLATITILGIVLTIAIGGVTQYLQHAKNQDFKMLEDNMKNAARSYLTRNISAVPSIGGEITITAQQLIDRNYLESLKDPDKTTMDCDLNNSKVIVTRSGAADDFNMTLNYRVCVVCSRLKSKTC